MLVRFVGVDLAKPGAFGVLVSHLPSAILSLPAFVSRSPPDNSCMYPSWISRSLCSAGIVRCIKPLAQSRNETNSSWVNGGTDKPCAIRANMRLRRPGSSQLCCHNQTDPLPATTLKGSIAMPPRARQRCLLTPHEKAAADVRSDGSTLNLARPSPSSHILLQHPAPVP
jgi:hypothetical protein